MKTAEQGWNAPEIWELYERGIAHHEQTALYEKTEQAYRFFLGEQWAGIKSGGEELPQYNFIQSIVEHKVASVAMNTMSITYTPLEEMQEKQGKTAELCRTLTRFAAKQWERLKMDQKCWETVKDACIAGEGYLYFYDGQCSAQKIDKANLYLANEQCDDLQKQEYLIIAERPTVAEIKKAARAYGIEEAQIGRITTDEAPWQEEKERERAQEKRQQTEEERGRCTALLMLYKDEAGTVCCLRCTKEVIFRPPVRLCGAGGRGLKRYPIASYLWMKQRGSARGIGEVTPLIPNQIEANKMLARRLMNAKLTAFPRMVYNADKVTNEEAMEEAGASIKVRDMQASRVGDLISYLAAEPMSPDARELSEELVSRSRDLAGAGDAAMGEINPEKASGAAIIAVRDQAALPLNEQIAAFRQFIEDVAAIWFEIWAAYHPMGWQMGNQTLTAQDLMNMRVGIRIDVAPNNPFSKFAQEQALEKLYLSGAITFEEYVYSLDENAAAPKQKLADILKQRARKSGPEDKTSGGKEQPPRKEEQKNGTDDLYSAGAFDLDSGFDDSGRDDEENSPAGRQ
ncbi:hypothetical protein [Acidaminobacterium chupaoyuni]